MRKIILPAVFFIALSAFIASCKNDAYLLTPPPIADQSFSEEFENISSATGNGWQFINASDPIGTGGWAGPAYPSFISSVWSGSGYAYSLNTVAQGSAGYTIQSTLSNWIVSKPIILQNGDKIVFYANSFSNDFTPTSLQVRINRHNEGVNVGSGADAGDFTDVLMSVNPFLTYNTGTSFPISWTRFEATVIGLNEPVKGRIGIRHFVPNGQQSNSATTVVGIDKLTYTSVQK